MMKYVVFLDILGFKERLKALSQGDAERFIGDFSTTIYNLWERNNDFNQHLKGYIVSDSLIINTKSVSLESLEILLSAVEQICRAEFSENSILLRGAIAKGEFDKLEAKELKSLGKGLIVGQAYVDAYLLEGTVKTLGIVLSKNVYEDILTLNAPSKYAIMEEVVNTEKHYVFRYLSIDYLLDSKHLERFVRLAETAKWLPHYYNALYFSLKNEDGKKSVQVFENIVKIINGNEPSEHWRSLNQFIKNCFNDDVVSDCQTRFLTFLRGNIVNGK